MQALLAPREYVNDLRHMIDEENEHFRTLVIHQDEESARRTVEVLEEERQNPSSASRGTSVELCCIDRISIRLTANNNLHIKLPGLGRRFVYDYYTGGRGPSFRATDGSIIYFDRRFTTPISQAVIDKLADLLARQHAVLEREIEDDLCNPPLDLLEDDTIEETHATIDLLR